MKSAIKHIVFTVLLLIGKVGYSQNYPIQTFVNIAPPYSSYLLDYADPFDNRMMITMTNTDFAAPSVLIKVRMTIEGPGYSMETDDLLMPTYTLSPGVPFEITGADLSPYLNSQNLIFNGGLTKEVYEQSQVLPEGPGTICVEVIDWQSGNQAVISNPACGFTNFALYQPPLIATPYCGKVYSQNEITTPPQIMFSWTPLHMSSPNSGGTMYHFELFQVMDANLDPNMVVYGPVLYEEHTPNTFVNFSLQQPLIVGNDYVWRVQAYEVNGRDLFENNGYSQVCTFKYGDAAENALAGETLTLESNGTGTRQGFAWWNASNLFNHYVLEVRKTGNPDYAWFPYETDNGDYKVNSLEPNTEYECRVKGVLGSAETEWSNTSVFTTLPKVTYGCGSNDLPGKNPNIIPAEFLKPGDIVQCGQFEMHVTAADPGSQPGRFTGYGRVTIPFMFMNMNVEYTDILIDEDLNLRDGKVEAITEGVDAWLEDQFTIFIPGSVDEVQVNPQDSVFVFYLGDGDTLHIEWPTDGPVTYQDEDGKVITLNPDGTFTISGVLNIDNDPLFATKDHQIVFKASNQQKYGFDAYPGIIEWQSHYPVIELSDSSHYFVPWKSVGSNQTDKVLAVVRGDNVGTPSFEDGNGFPLMSTQVNDSTYEVTVGNLTNSGIKVYALDDDGLRIGKLNVLNYASKNLDVVVIPVGNAVPPNQAALQDKLNDIFGQAYTFFGVTIDTVFDYQEDLGVNGVDAPVTTLMNKYSQEMKDIRDGYFASHSSENKLYLFVVEDLEGDLDGYMVRGKSVGFIEDEKDLETYAHEIGHGAFGLEHTFPKVDLGQTNNLMDYHGPNVTDKSHLTAQQWKEIHEWSIIWSIFDDEEDGALVTVSDISVLKPFENLDGTYTFLAKSGKPITLPANISKVTFTSFDDFWNKSGERITQIGTLNTFTYDDSTFVSVRDGEDFEGYKYKISQGNFGRVYHERLTSQNQVKHVITGLPCISSNDNYHFYIYLLDRNSFTQYASEFLEHDYSAKGPLMKSQEIMNAFSNVTNPDGVLVSATVSDSYTNELKSVLGYMQEVQCGLDFIYCILSAQLLADNPETYECFSGISENASTAFGTEWLENYMSQSPSGLIPSGLNDIDENTWLRVNSLGRAKMLYETIWNYNELIDNKEMNLDLSQDLNSYDPYAYAVTNIINWVYNDEEGNDLTDEEVFCILSKIYIDYRLDMIQTAYTTMYFLHLGTNKENLIVDLIATIPSKEDFDQLLLFFNDTWDGDKKFWKIFDDVKASGARQRLIYSILGKLIEFGYYGEQAVGAYGEWDSGPSNSLPQMSSNYMSISKYSAEIFADPLNSNKSHRIVSQNDCSHIGNSITLTFDSECTYCSESEGCVNAHDSRTYSFLELIRIDIHDDLQFQHPYLNRKLKRGDFVVVPAFYAYWLISAQQFVEDMAVVRSVVAIAAGILSAATMNPGPMLALELSWNAAELIVANMEDDILSSEDEFAQDLVEIYNVASVVAGVGFLARGIVMGTTKYFIRVQANQMRSRITQFKNNSALTAEGYASELSAISKYYRFLVKYQNKIKDLSASEIKNVRQMYFEAAINKYGIGSKNLKIHIEDGVAGDAIKIVDGNGVKVEIGGMVYSQQYQTPISILDDGKLLSREINSTDEIVGELDGVIYRLKSSSDIKANGEIKIIKTASGEIKFKVVGVGMDFNTFLNKFQNYTKIHAWLSGNQVPFGIMQKLDDWLENNPAIISNLENDFGEVSNFGDILLRESGSLEAWELVRRSVNNSTNSGYTQLATDELVLSQIVDMMQPNSGFRLSQGNSWESTLTEIISKHDHLRCSTCDGVFNSAPEMHVFLADVSYFYQNFSINGKASKFFKWLKRETSGPSDSPDIAINNANTSLSEMYHTINELRKRGFTESNVTEFGPAFSNVQNSRHSDILTVGGVHYEFKNKKYTANSVPSEQEISQVMGDVGAFANITNMSQYKWTTFAGKGNNVDDLKTMWQQVFLNRKQNLFNNMSPELRQSLGVDGLDGQTKLDNLIGDKTSVLYSFIE